MKPTIVTAGVVPYKGREILLQERDRSKSGEEYAFWGGRVECGETPEQAAVREMREELDWNLVHFKRLGPTEKDQERQTVIEWTFMTPMPDVRELHVREGRRAVKVTVAEARKLRMNVGDGKILDLVEAWLSRNNFT